MRMSGSHRRFAREVIRKVDKSEVLDKQAIQSPVFGIISPERLSGGTKTLLLMKNFMPFQLKWHLNFMSFQIDQYLNFMPF